MDSESQLEGKKNRSASNGLTGLSEWQALQQHFSSVKQSSIADLFAQDANRFDRFSIRVGQLFVDYSKHRISDQTLSLLLDLVQACNLAEWRERMFSGATINFTEDRAVLHTALRKPAHESVIVDGQNVVPQVHAVLDKIRVFSDKVRNQQWLGYSGKVITDIVNIGIGGSDLGPRMVVNALTPYVHQDLNFHFVSNVDPCEINQTLAKLNPETTLFVIASKTFTTQETLLNAETARSWFLATAQNKKAVALHFVAVSSNREAVEAFGIDHDNMFEFWDWVGGRYSLWSAIGLSIAIAIGMDEFVALLAGAHEMDEHFRQASPEANLPILMAVIGLWYFNFYGAETQGIFPYDYYLRDLPKYLQQADMESNGKRIRRDNQVVNYTTGPIIWGETGINGQHAYYQLVHQGTRLIPCDFIMSLDSPYASNQAHTILAANFLAQTEALCQGRNEQAIREEMRAAGIEPDVIAKLARHRSFTGNQPTTSIVIDRLTPHALGNLLALYEHKIFVQGIIWNINSFDQWGVELGKVLSRKIEKQLQAGQRVSDSVSSNGLLNYFITHLRKL